MKKDLKINYGILEEMTSEINRYKSALTEMERSASNMVKMLRQNTSMAIAELEEMYTNFTVELKKIREELQDMYGILSGYTNEMQAIIRPINKMGFTRVDRNDIYRNMQSILSACSAVAMLKTQRGYTDFSNLYSMIKVDTEERRREEENYRKLEKIWNEVIPRYARQMDNQAEALNSIHKKKIIPYENKDDEFNTRVRRLEEKYFWEGIRKQFQQSVEALDDWVKSILRGPMLIIERLQRGNSDVCDRDGKSAEGTRTSRTLDDYYYNLKTQGTNNFWEDSKFFCNKWYYDRDKVVIALNKMDDQIKETGKPIDLLHNKNMIETLEWATNINATGVWNNDLLCRLEAIQAINGLDQLDVTKVDSSYIKGIKAYYYDHVYNNRRSVLSDDYNNKKMAQGMSDFWDDPNFFCNKWYYDRDKVVIALNKIDDQLKETGKPINLLYNENMIETLEWATNIKVTGVWNNDLLCRLEAIQVINSLDQFDVTKLDSSYMKGINDFYYAHVYNDKRTGGLREAFGVLTELFYGMAVGVAQSGILESKLNISKEHSCK